MWHNTSMPARANVGSMVWLVCTVGCWDSEAWQLAGACKPVYSLCEPVVAFGECHQVKPVSGVARLKPSMVLIALKLNQNNNHFLRLMITERKKYKVNK